MENKVAESPRDAPVSDIAWPERSTLLDTVWRGATSVAPAGMTRNTLRVGNDGVCPTDIAKQESVAIRDRNQAASTPTCTDCSIF